MGIYKLPNTNREEIEVVGENFHIDNIAALGLIEHKEFENGQAVKTEFDIVPEPDNPYSKTGMSLSVRKDGLLLGYLPSGTEKRISLAVQRITASGHVVRVQGTLWTLKARDGLKAAIRVYLPGNLADSTLKDQVDVPLIPVASTYKVPNAYQARPGDAKVKPKQSITPEQGKAAVKVILKLIVMVIALPVCTVIFTPVPGVIIWLLVGLTWVVFPRKVSALFKRKQ